MIDGRFIFRHNLRLYFSKHEEQRPATEKCLSFNGRSTNFNNYLISIIKWMSFQIQFELN